MKLNKLSALVLLGTAIIAVSCSTQKADWKNVQFHNTTTHYNIWWNGNESLKKGVEQLERKVKDDYTQILPVYKLGTKEDAMSQNPQFDRAIEKSIKAIKKHSIFVNGQEHVPYISKCYLMMAYATYYKHDISNAANTCQMLVSQYSGSAIADEAAILQARCSIMEQRYSDAEGLLDELVVNDAKDNFAPSQRLNLYLAMADCTLPQEKYKKCVQFLKQALDQHPTREQKARICYILGQIYQDQDKRPTASKYFEKVLKCGPDYEMEFNARLSLASCADLQHTNQAKLERLLDNMLKDKKNTEFLDQIYYAKGEMYMGMRDVKKACESFKKSVSVSRTNPAQKARSAIRLGGILYDKLQDYDKAQLYYDTAINLISKDYPRFANIKSRHELLSSLVSFTRVFEANDSLIAVADMPETKRIELINKKIEELKKQEEEAKERELLAQLSNENSAQQNVLQGDWYFYNANTVQRGKETFRTNWGMRALEDFWFLSKKGLLGTNMLALNTIDADDTNSVEDALASSDSVETKTDESGYGNPNDPHCVAYYLKSLPQTQQERDSMQLQTAECLLNAGYIYFDGIHNIPKALECYLRMANQYPEHEAIVQAFFMLYKIYDKQGNTPNSNYYRDMVLMGFPDSDFSNLILDEDYYKEILHRGQLIKEDYNEVYSLYRKRRYDDVLAAVNTAKELYRGNPMLGKFQYWEGLSYARMDNKASAISTFRSIVDSYPETDSIVPLALAQLEYLQGEGGRYIANSGGESDEKVEDGESNANDNKKVKRKATISDAIDKEELSPEAMLYRYKENMPHLVLILVNDKKIRATQVRSKLGNFILTYYSNSGLQAQPLMFTDSTQLIYINTFNNASSAVDFASHLTLAEGPLADYSPEDYKVFAISKQNYTTFYNRKQVDAYLSFYNKYYKK
ncbi:MAG: tetratricopeptide repeat protein [Bacteroidales bacterium]|nr:tetratricopeptide repeat protein [Bacteroidales bacterium]